jgi:hypothetical protein
MGSSYVYGMNPFRDYLLEAIKYDFDISDSKMKPEIDASFKYILKNVLNNGKEAVHLDFEIIKKDSLYKIRAKNAPSALWLSGVLVENVEDMLDAKVFVIGERRYKYDKKTGSLTFTIKK